MRRADRLPRAAACRDRGARRGRRGSACTGSARRRTSSIQVARHLGHDVYVCTRGERAQQLARELGARWAGGADEAPPVELDSAIIFAPAGPLVPRGAARGAPGRHGRVRRHPHEPDPGAAYELLWGERVLRSVANLTRADGHEFVELAPRFRIQTEVQEFPLEEANEALARLKSGELEGTAVLVP